MKKIIIALLLTVSTSVCMSTEVNLNIDYNVDGEVFNLNQQYTNSKGIKYKVIRLEYYMCQFELDGQPLNGTYVLANGNTSKYFLGNLDIEQVETVQLSLGVEKVNNIGVDPNMYDVFHPLAPKNPSMHWGWAAGYRFWAIEALTDPDGDGEYDKSFQYHILGDESFRTLSLDVNADKENGKIDIMVDFNIQKLLAPVDMAQFGIFHEFYNNSKEVQELVDNITTSGAISSQAVTSVEVVNNNLTISPNPTTEYLNVGNEYLNSNYDIVSMSGNKVLSGNIISNQIKLEAIPTGTYIVRIFDNNGVLNTAKFVKK